MEVNRIYNQDCLEFLASVPSDTIDLVVTSPPYNFGGFSRNGRQRQYDTYSDNMPIQDYKDWIGKVLKECSRIIKKGGTIYWNHKGMFREHIYYPPFFVVELCPIQLYQHIVWKYPSSPDVAKVKFYPRHEEVFMFTKGQPQYFDEDMAKMGDVWEISHIQKNEHPAPFPLSLAKRCITASCPEQGLVFDPFMGSGTTAVATIQVGGVGSL